MIGTDWTSLELWDTLSYFNDLWISSVLDYFESKKADSLIVYIVFLCAISKKGFCAWWFLDTETWFLSGEPKRCAVLTKLTHPILLSFRTKFTVLPVLFNSITSSKNLIFKIWYLFSIRQYSSIVNMRFYIAEFLQKLSIIDPY